MLWSKIRRTLGAQLGLNRAAGFGVLAILLACCARLGDQRLSYPEHRLSYQALVSTEIQARGGEPLYVERSLVGGYGRPVALGEISPYLVSATLSGEDAQFFGHPGVDPIGVSRAAWLNVSRGRLAYGGSSVTQQLAKLIEPRPRTLYGKFQEALDAFALERRLSKAQILEQYLNRVYYGRLAYGAEAGARRYFGRAAADLSLDQAALLAVLPRAPTYYDLDQHPERALARRRHILFTMAERGWISDASAQRAASAPLQLIPRGQERRAPHVIDLLANERRQARQSSSDRSTAAVGAGQVRTSIDSELQRAVEVRLGAHLRTLRETGATQAAVVVIDNATRQVRALVGSAGYDQQELAGANNGALSWRPPGSTLKPFIYAVAIERGARRGSLVLDADLSFAGYAPRAASGKHHGWLPLEKALGSSLNAPAVLLTENIGAETLRDRLAALKLIPPSAAPTLALALGGTSVRLIDLTNAYATLASSGLARGWTLSAAPPLTPGHRLFSARAADEVMRMLSQSAARRAEFGLDTPLDSDELNVGAVAAKTGTSQSFCDNWTIASTATHSVGVWVGNFDGSPLRGTLAMQGAAPLARSVVLATSSVAVRPRAEPPAWTQPARPGAAHSADGWATLSEHPLLEHPAPGARFRMDSLLSEGALAVTLTATPRAAAARVGTTHARFSVDGQALPLISSDHRRPRFSARWPLRVGQHAARVEILDERGVVIERSPEHIFHVEGT